ncbi:MAG: Holliday junction branch migration protein RuvA [Candidatus Cloacimonas sp. 4484_275]|nr:MAG: Holliday junction branch migration protein RuvA [Candidatus Cloacimonas sp. 4484_275]
MFSYLRGILKRKNPVSAVVECSGVGYEVLIPLSTFDRLPEIGKEIEMQIHFSFSENDGIRLFGFFTQEEKELFQQLISVSKIGPKIALSILSGMSVKEFVQAVLTENVSLISTIPGLGKKSSERLIIELKDKVGKISGSEYKAVFTETSEDIIREAESALLTLGYKLFEIQRIFSELLRNHNFKTSEEIVKASIKALYKKSNL